MTIPGIGPVTAEAIVATLGADGVRPFTGPREFTATSASCLASAPREARSGSAGSPRWAMPIWGSCWSWAPMRCSTTKPATTIPCANRQGVCLPRIPSSSSLRRSPTS